MGLGKGINSIMTKTQVTLTSNILKRGDRFEVDGMSSYKIIRIERIDHDNNEITYTDTGSSLTTNKQWNREHTTSIEEFFEKVSMLEYVPNRGVRG